MPATLYHVGATASCPHQGPVTTVSTNARVTVSGQAVAVLTDQSTVAGCPFQVPVPGGTKPQPCVRVQWASPATRVFVGGTPVLLQTSKGICSSAEQIPQGPPSITVTQTRVVGS
jgi:hypothetical protein